MRLIVEIDVDAFDPDVLDNETARILRELADNIEHNGYSALDDKREAKLRDVNGNTVGMARTVG